MRDAKKFEHKKSLGQHFLTSDIVPKWMCDAGDISDGDTVLEIGPGTGVLTRELLSRGAKVIALEADPRALVVLEETFSRELAEGQLTLHHTDVRTLALTDIPGITDHSFKVVANIPYYLSGMLFRTFLESSVQPTALVYLVQKEVAKRITTDISRGEKESLLSLSVKVYSEPTYVRTVTKGHFAPQPKVDSAIISLRNVSRNNFENISESLFFTVLHLGFGQKRKQLLGNLAKQYDRDILMRIFSTCCLQVSTRAEDVDLVTWLKLVAEIQSHMQSTAFQQK